MTAHLWLRAEIKPGEKRRALSLENVQRLTNDGFKITVERSEQSIFANEDYAKLGVAMVDENEWMNAPSDAYILGLKELPEDDTPLIHRHIFFAHAYKNQDGWKELLGRFERGNGKLYDLEFLVDENQKRIAAFGYWAGFAGAGVAALIWTHYKKHNSFESFKLPANYETANHMVQAVKKELKDIRVDSLRALVTGMRGRSGTGAKEFLDATAFNVTGWDKDETSNGGPFAEILDYDVFVNCVLMMSKLPPFLDRTIVDNADNFCVISDVSCDPTGPFNSLPIYDKASTMSEPLEIINSKKNPIVMSAIDHLPSLLPKESSEDFSNQLLPYFSDLVQENGVWHRAIELFNKKLAEL
jgi:saccharopine dehydrogenase (NAD+, L-lysine forming)